MSNKNVLHRSKLEEFREWLIDKDIVIKDNKGDFEVLRFKAQSGAMPIIFNGASSEHLSCNQAAIGFVHDFIQETKKKDK